MKGIPVINWERWEKKVERTSFKESKGMDGYQVLNLFQSKDVTIDLEGFYDNSSTVGWTTLYGFKTHINTKFLNTFDDSEIFGHITHEWCHILGFAHRALLWSNKYKSVPYALGYLTRDSYAEYYSVPRDEKALVGPIMGVPVNFAFMD